MSTAALLTRAAELDTFTPADISGSAAELRALAGTRITDLIAHGLIERVKPTRPYRYAITPAGRTWAEPPADVTDVDALRAAGLSFAEISARLGNPPRSRTRLSHRTAEQKALRREADARLRAERRAQREPWECDCCHEMVPGDEAKPRAAEGEYVCAACRHADPYLADDAPERAPTGPEHACSCGARLSAYRLRDTTPTGWETSCAPCARKAGA